MRFFIYDDFFSDAVPYVISESLPMVCGISVEFIGVWREVTFTGVSSDAVLVVPSGDIVVVMSINLEVGVVAVEVNKLKLANLFSGHNFMQNIRSNV